MSMKKKKALKSIKFTKAELKNYRKVFNSFDKNGDGNVDAGEMHDVRVYVCVMCVWVMFVGNVCVIIH